MKARPRPTTGGLVRELAALLTGGGG
jgi:hypothetical protein